MSDSLKNNDKVYYANISNWLTPPFNRWAFNHVREFIPTIIVEGGNQNFPLQHGDKILTEELFTPFLSDTETDAIIILHKGQIVYEAYSNGNNIATPHILMSATKAIVGLIAGLLGCRGEIDLTSAVSVYIPEMVGTAYEHVALRQLLDMRTGIVLDEKQQAIYDLATNWYPLNGNSAIGLHQFFAQSKQTGVLADDSFRYASSNTDLLGWAIEKATGRSFNAILSELLWKPMGAQNVAYLTVDKDGSPRCTGGLCATVRDFARLGQLIAEDGYANGNEIIPLSLIKDITNNGDKKAWKNGQWGKAFAPISANMCYRNGWYIIDEQPQMMFAMGIYGQNLFIDRTNNIVIAKFSSWKEPTDYRALGLTHHMVKKIITALTA